MDILKDFSNLTTNIRKEVEVSVLTVSVIGVSSVGMGLIDVVEGCTS